MERSDLKVGQCYDMPSGISRRIVSLTDSQVRLEKLNGKNPGQCAWEHLPWFLEWSGAELSTTSK